jgi:hypothetical protein
MDHLGPFVPTARKNTQLLVVVDAMTKYTWLHPTKTTATQPVISFLDNLIQTYGVPRRIIADRGPGFSSNQFREYCREHGIKLVLTAVSTPRAAGQVERMNAVILDRLIATIPDEETWDKYLNQVRMSLNNTVSETTKVSPNELLFGYQPRTTAESFLAHEIDDYQDDDDVLSDADQLEKRFSKRRYNLRNFASRKNKERNAEIIRRTKGRREARKFAVNDYVLIPNQNPATKTKPRFKGPYRISAIYPNDRYRVEGFDDQHRRYDSVHASEHLKRICVQNTAENEVKLC